MRISKLLVRNWRSYGFSTAETKPAPSIKQVLKKYGQELQNAGVMEKLIPRKFTQQNLAAFTLNQRFTQGNNHLNSLNKAFSQPIWDLLDRGGKRWRPILGMLVAQLYGHNRSQVFELAAFCQIIHNGSLIIDDIQDNSSIRRNRECVHKLYGVDISINAGNFMYYAPMLAIYNSPNYSQAIKAELVQIYLQEIVQLHMGQGWDILWHNTDKLDGEYPTEKQYLQMTAHKTGVLARLTVRMMCAYVNAPQQQRQILSQFVENMGVAFQIQDDLLNLQGQEFKKTKGYSGEDIHQGKITLMVIHHLTTGSAQSKVRLLDILRMKTQDPKIIAEALGLLHSTKSLDYARNLMLRLINQSTVQLQSVFPPSESRQLLKELAEFGIQRTN